MKNIIPFLFLSILLFECTSEAKKEEKIVIKEETSSKYFSYKELPDTNFYSKNLGYDKELSILVPFEWSENSATKFPLIIIFDKQLEETNQYLLNSIETLTSSYQIPSFVVISVNSEEDKRFFETKYAPDKLGEKNENFLFEELIPFAKKELNTNDFKLFIGHSRYGFYTSNLFVKRINDLNGVISFCPFINEGNIQLTDSLINYNGNSTKYYRAGVESWQQKDFEKFKQNNLHKKNIDFEGKIFPNAGHNSIPRIEISNSLYEIFEYWYIKTKDYQQNNNRNLEKTNEEIKNHYGDELNLGIGIYNGVASHYAQNEEYQKAIDSWMIGLEVYPDFIEMYIQIAEAKKELGQDYQYELQTFKDKIKTNDIYSEFEKTELMDYVIEFERNQ